MANFVSTRTGQFTYFSLQLGDENWNGKDVLDFGGNIGNILRDPNCKIDENRYWCVEVLEDAVEQGKQAYPRAHWVFYDRYCFSFNPRGIRNLPVPDLGKKFDYIVAFSVFTNTKLTEMLQLVSQLEAMLSENGKLAFTFIDPYYHAGQNGSNFQWRLDLEKERGNISIREWKDLARRAQQANWFMLVNGGDLYIENENIQPYDAESEKTCYVYHTADYMKALFPQAVILPPVNNEMQHCCVISKS
jgi:hypothetical protein